MNIGSDSDRGAFIGVAQFSQVKRSYAQAYLVRDTVDKWNFEVQTGAGDSDELAETRDYASGLLVYGKPTWKDGDDEHDAAENQADVKQDSAKSYFFHLSIPQ